MATRMFLDLVAMAADARAVRRAHTAVILYSWLEPGGERMLK